MAVVRHLGFCKSSKFQPVRRANMRHHAKCCANRSNKLTKQSTDYRPTNAKKVHHCNEIEFVV